MDHSPPGSSVHGILQARILERVAMPSSRGFSWPRGLNLHLLDLLHCRLVLYHQPPPGRPRTSSLVLKPLGKEASLLSYTACCCTRLNTLVKSKSHGEGNGRRHTGPFQFHLPLSGIGQPVFPHLQNGDDIDNSQSQGNVWPRDKWQWMFASTESVILDMWRYSR